jgi:uncharacterized protein YoxC
LLIIAFFIASKWWLALLAFSVGYIWYIIMATLWLILSLMEYPVRQGFTRLGIVYILIFVAACLISFFSYLYLAPPPMGDVITNYRISGLLVAIGYLILLLGIVTKESPVLQSLIETRRSIAFNRVDINGAVRQAEIALTGMQAPDAIQKDLHPILSLVDRINEATNSLVYQVRTMQSHLPNAEDSRDVILAKLKILTTHHSTCEFILRDRASALQELNFKFQQLMKRRQRIESIIPEASEFFNQLDGGMKTILEEADQRFASYQQEAIEYDKRLSDINTALGLNLKI